MHTPTSLLTPETLALVANFGADLVVTVLALIAILVPVGLSLWGIGFGLKKGLNYLQAKAAKAV